MTDQPKSPKSGEPAKKESNRAECTHLYKPYGHKQPDGSFTYTVKCAFCKDEFPLSLWRPEGKL